jgi:hypothetical protein
MSCIGPALCIDTKAAVEAGARAVGTTSSLLGMGTVVAAWAQGAGIGEGEGKVGMGVAGMDVVDAGGGMAGHVGLADGAAVAVTGQGLASEGAPGWGVEDRVGSHGVVRAPDVVCRGRKSPIS